MDASQQHVPQSSTAPNNASNAPDRSIDLRHVQPLVPLPAWTVADSDAALGAVRWLEDYNNVLARELKGQVFHQRFSQVKIEGLEKLLDLVRTVVGEMLSTVSNCLRGRKSCAEASFRLLILRCVMLGTPPTDDRSLASKTIIQVLVAVERLYFSVLSWDIC